MTPSAVPDAESCIHVRDQGPGTRTRGLCANDGPGDQRDQRNEPVIAVGLALHPSTFAHTASEARGRRSQDFSPGYTAATHSPAQGEFEDNQSRADAADLETELRRLNIVQKNSRPNHPTTCGKVDRFQQTLKKWLGAEPVQRGPPAVRTDRVDHTGVVALRGTGRLHGDAGLVMRLRFRPCGWRGLGSTGAPVWARAPGDPRRSRPRRPRSTCARHHRLRPTVRRVEVSRRRTATAFDHLGQHHHAERRDRARRVSAARMSAVAGPAPTTTCRDMAEPHLGGHG